MRLVKASEMKEMDQATIQEMGIAGVVLMENAARGATRKFLDHFTPLTGARVLILCGRGNNGGDGYVMARYLKDAGLEVTVLVLSASAKITGDALTNLEIIRKMDLRVLEVPDQEAWKSYRGEIESNDYIIDGIFGTGLNAPVRGFFGDVIEAVNKSKGRIMAIDIPSGLHADNGQIMGVAVKAELTVTFGFPKLGHMIYPGVALVGRLACIDIGIPDVVAERIPDRYHLIEPRDFRELLGADREDIHKGNRGHLLIIAGSVGKTGAAALTAQGAVRAGAGLVTVGVPNSLNPILENKLTEAMTVPLPETEEATLSFQAKESIERLLEGKTALALGPGLSTHPETVGLVRDIVAHCPLPMVVDADGLNALAGALDILKTCRGSVLLTPHPGEMARLTGLQAGHIQADRIETAERFVEKHGCCLVLKGARSVVAASGGRTYINPTGNPALSSGGSGDVLTGLIGGFMARGGSVIDSALAGVYMHGLAADYLADSMGQIGLFASDLLTPLPGLMEGLQRREWPLSGDPVHEAIQPDLG